MQVMKRSLYVGNWFLNNTCLEKFRGLKVCDDVKPNILTNLANRLEKSNVKQ
jgi:hypothetical protein